MILKDGTFSQKTPDPEIRVENGATSNPVTSNGSPPHLLSLLHKGISEVKGFPSN